MQPSETFRVAEVSGVPRLFWFRSLFFFAVLYAIMCLWVVPLIFRLALVGVAAMSLSVQPYRVRVRVADLELRWLAMGYRIHISEITNAQLTQVSHWRYISTPVVAVQLELASGRVIKVFSGIQELQRLHAALTGPHERY